MPVDIAHGVLGLAGCYVAIGTIVGLPFVFAGIERVDPAARNAPWSFRLLVFPGVVALWPLMAGRWWNARRSS